LAAVRPRVLWAGVRIDWHTSWRLQTVTLVVGAWLYSLGLAIAAADNIDVGVHGSWIGIMLFLSLVLAVPYFMVLFLVTEARGAWARLRKRRDGSAMDKARSTSVTAHASPAWLFGGALAPLTALVLLAVETLLPVGTVARAHVIGQSVCLIAGLLWFLALSRMGYHALEFANQDDECTYV
jgi:hypothetical protein